MKKISFPLMLTLLINCLSTQTHHDREARRPFDPAEYKFVKLNGSAEISGRIFIPAREGVEKACSGCVITLNPATSYSEEFFIKTVQNGMPIEEADIRVLKYIRTITSNDSGGFSFKNIAGGKYYIYSPIVYEIHQPGGGYTKTDAYVYETVYIKDGQKQEIVLRKK